MSTVQRFHTALRLKPIKSADFLGEIRTVLLLNLLPKYWPIKSGDKIGRVTYKSPLIFSRLIKSTDKIGRFYRLSVISLTLRYELWCGHKLRKYKLTCVWHNWHHDTLRHSNNCQHDTHHSTWSSSRESICRQVESLVPCTPCGKPHTTLYLQVTSDAINHCNSG